MTDGLVSFGAKLAMHARDIPFRIAVSCGDEHLTYGELHSRSNRLAHGLARLGVRQDDLVSVALPNGVDFVTVCHAIWKLGATPQPLSFRLPASELAAVVEIAKPRLVVAEPGMLPCPMLATVSRIKDAGGSDDDLPDVVASVAKAPTSGGSTGRPKLILSGSRGLTPTVTPAVGELLLDATSVVLLPGPLYHNASFTMMMTATAYGAQVILLPRFDAEATLAAIERHRVSWTYFVPTMMSRIWRLPESVRDSFDRSSLRVAWHMAAPCPAWLKEAFIDWLAPAGLMELYTGTEGIASTVISGDEWLAHRGSVGRVVKGEMKIVDPAGRDLPQGEIGEIYMRRPTGAPPTYRYLGAEAKTSPGGWQTLGDLGWFDDDGYLFLADRRTDLILVGGANVYPAEVEAALEEYPRVGSCAVIGLPDDDMGAQAHAIVQRSGDVSEAQLRAHMAARLASYKLPRSYEFVEHSLRDEAGKVRRSALREERLGGTRTTTSEVRV